MCISQSYSIEWKVLASQDLIDIVTFIAKDNFSRAISFKEELETKVNFLIEFPYMGKTSSASKITLRELVIHKNYIVFYRVLESEKIVEILRVKHVALDN